MVLSMDRWVGKVAVVTGVSSGIGAAVTEKLVENGLVVVGLARRLDRLEQLAEKLNGKKQKFFPIKADLKNEEDILNAFKWIKENVGPVHVLVNNAAVHGSANLFDGNTETWENVFKTNVIGLCIVTREAIKDMRANNVDGHIFHINSIGGHQVYNAPNQNVYPASKFAVRALAETLRLELKSLKCKIKITNLSPGLVNTEMLREVLKGVPELFEKLLEGNEIIEAENIADGVVYALSTPPNVQIQQLTIRSVNESF